VTALITAGIQRVVWAMDDPNPAHAGRAEALLTQQNITVTRGVGEPAAQELLTYWTHFIRTGRPWVIAKAGLSLDGKITRPPGEGQWITSEAARAEAMSLRRHVDAILVGAETVRQDDPLLTLRPASPDRPMPWRVILSRSGQLPPTARILTDENAERTLILREQPWDRLWAELAQRGITSVLIEGGADILTQVLSQQLAQEAYFYQAPLISGSGQSLISSAAWAGPSLDWENKEISLLGDNVRWHLRHPLSTK
jgi:diaminohydroxyphosphoribosylaminopyrimidine deaminase/5-amino-6-(5-phosphoribosylamino)uracil reductase